MKILLAACNAKYIHSNLAVYDLQAYASDYADHIVLKEYTINQQNHKKSALTLKLNQIG